MRYLLFFIICSCTLTPQKTDPSTPWDILEGHLPTWNTEKIVSLLGKPAQVIPDRGEENWVYRSSVTKHQTWAIGVTKDNKVSGMAYLPEEDLRIADVEKRWASKKCEHKRETVLIAGHHETEERSLVCDNGRIRVFYNRYNEVEGIYVK